jgi:hypothetical protein
MNFKSNDLEHPRVWLRDVVRFTLDEFIADPLNLQRALTAMTVVYQYHERLFSCLSQTGEAPAESLEGFRAVLARTCRSLEVVAQAVVGPAGPGLALTNIVSSGRLIALLGAEGLSVQRAVIISEAKRQLIPLLEDVMAAYRRVLDGQMP